MSTTTTNYGLIKPDTTDPILIGQLNDNADTIDAALKENADAIENKPDASDIPSPSTAAPAMDGTGSAGTSNQYARADHVHPSDTSKQNALTTAQLAAVNSGIDSTKVEQIETNKNNILSLTDNVAITSIISDVTTANGFTLEAQSFLYKQGKHIFGRLIISSTNAYTTSDVEPCTISKYKPSPHYVAFCGLGADMWKIKSIGYAYISSSSGTFKVNDSGNNSNYTANIPIDYMTA